MNIDKLTPSNNNFEIYEVKPSEVAALKNTLAKARQEIGQREQVFSSAKVLTVVMWPVVPRRRRVSNLLKCSKELNALLNRTDCVVFPKNEVAQYVKGGYINALEQSHMAEHLVLPFLKYAQVREGHVDAESVDLIDLGLGKIVTVFTGRYDHAILKDILLFVWHWMGQAILRARFPNTIQFERMLLLRISTLKNERFTTKDIERIMTAK